MKKISLKTNTILIFVVCMISISGCSDVSAESMDIPYDTVKVTDEGNISLKTVKEGSDYKEPDRNEAKEPAVSAFTKENFLDNSDNKSALSFCPSFISVETMFDSVLK